MPISSNWLTGSNTTVGYGAGEKFNVFLNVDEIGLPNRDVIFTINGVNYTRSTGEDGIAGITINLLPGKYLIKYYYRGENRINPSSGEAYVDFTTMGYTNAQEVENLEFDGITFEFDKGSTINCFTKSESFLCCILCIIIETTISIINKMTKLKSFGFSFLITIKSKIIIEPK